MIFEGDDEFAGLRGFEEGVGIERFGEAGIDDACGDAVFAELGSDLLGFFEHDAVCPEVDLAGGLEALCFAERKGLGLVFDGGSGGVAARVTNEGGALVGEPGGHHIGEFIFVGGCHEDAVRDGTEVGDVEEAVVGGAVVGRESGTVHAKEDGEFLKGDVVNDGIDGALQEGGVNRANGMEAGGGHPGGEEDRVFLRDADVEALVGQFFFKNVESGAGGHRGGDADDVFILTGKAGEGFAHDVLVFGRGSGGSGFTFSGLDIEGARAVETLRVLEGDVVAFAFGGMEMEEDGLFGVFGELEVMLDLLGVVPVDRADVAYPVFFKEGRGDKKILGFLFPFDAEVDEGLPAGDLFEESFDVVVEAVVDGVCDEVVEIAGEGADILGNRPFVVVEDNDEPLGAGGDVVEGLHCDAAGEGGVAADRNHVLAGTAPVAGGCHPEGRGKGGAGVTRTEGVVRAFRAVHETAQAAVIAKFVEVGAVAPREEFMYVGLMGDIEDEAILGGVKNAVQGDGEFNDAEVGAHVSAVAGGCANDALADFPGEMLALLQAQVLEVCGRMNLFKEGHATIRFRPRDRALRGF